MAGIHSSYYISIYCLPCVWHTSVVNKNIQSFYSYRIYIPLGEKINHQTNKIIGRKLKQGSDVVICKLREGLKWGITFDIGGEREESHADLSL